MMDVTSIDVIRERWRKARHQLFLDDRFAPNFMRSEPADRVQELTMRLLILTSDPEAYRVEFDRSFWKYWESDVADPIIQTPMRWGNCVVPTASCGLQAYQVGDSLYRYAGVRRDGGLDVAVGRECGWQGSESTRLLLVPLVGRIWSACHLYKTVIERFSLAGPWEVVVGVQAQKATLSGFAKGWAEPETHPFDNWKSSTASLLCRRELFELTADWDQKIAYSIGAEVEDAFGCPERRFIACQGPHSGDFARDRYGWR